MLCAVTPVLCVVEQTGMQSTCLELGVCVCVCVFRKLADSLWGYRVALLGCDTGPNDLLTALPRLNFYGTMILN